MAKSGGSKKHWFRYLVAGLAAAAAVGGAIYRFMDIRSDIKDEEEVGDE